MDEVKAVTTADANWPEQHQLFSDCFQRTSQAVSIDGREFPVPDTPLSQHEETAFSYIPIVLEMTEASACLFQRGSYGAGLALVRPAMEAMLKFLVVIATPLQDAEAIQKQITDRPLKVTKARLESLASRHPEFQALCTTWADAQVWINTFIHGGANQLTSHYITQDTPVSYEASWIETAYRIITPLYMGAVCIWLDRLGTRLEYGRAQAVFSNYQASELSA